ncbi:MAG: hypothetical protein HOI95_17645 [Chromatiales bacterium]|jgi:hypothetical protein|nr:hypothetical protein [Pseudomonadota bacterium]MBT6275946.1 hypothetical protein [Chromatiales bacterium]MBT6348043.1 hypothetical protein [Pseudomonadota bacterium]
MRPLVCCAVVLAALLFPAPASAAYVSTYADWRELSMERKRGYVMGYVDGLLSSGAVDLDWANSYAFGVDDCFSELEIGTDMFIDALDAAFSRNSDSWDRGLTWMISGVVFHTCLKQINRRREVHDLPPWKPWPSWK